jgi:2-polyprenyl-3-methyl-5-hydroxy-6-metoxy-1,4-benzoquinol methylase
MTATEHLCQSCRMDRLHAITEFAALPRVTSDSKPFQHGGKLFICTACGLVQKIPDAQWQREAAEIYADYEMYHQSASNDQAVFDPVSGKPSGRCQLLAQRLLDSGLLAAHGTLLDVGAGSGAMLAAFSNACKEWRLYGLDLDNRKEKALQTIPQFECLFTVPLQQLTRQFDLLTLIHSLEHFAEPLAMLRTARAKIAAQGSLFVQVNNVAQTPFDLVVADHLCHFTPRSLAVLLARADFAIRTLRTDWVNKEISVLAGAQAAKDDEPAHDDPVAMIEQIQGHVRWLKRMLEHAARAAADGPFGVFGTSVAATWLTSGLGDAVKFFVDEDPGREGRTHLNRPILKPAQVPAGAIVYLAFVPQVSAAIAQRLAGLPIRFAQLSNARE